MFSAFTVPTFCRGRQITGDTSEASLCPRCLLGESAEKEGRVGAACRYPQVSQDGM